MDRAKGSRLFELKLRIHRLSYDMVTSELKIGGLINGELTSS